MNNNARDTQFQGFAEALWKELCNDCFGEWWDTDNPHAGDDAQQAIARRAYDFACHLLKNGDPIDLDTSGEYCTMKDEEAKRRVNNLPDLTELPKEQE